MDRNNLDRETSPYLLQHKDNPVHWQPWGPSALREARARDRVIFLSIGYFSCYWCRNSSSLATMFYKNCYRNLWVFCWGIRCKPRVVHVFFIVSLSI